MDTALFIVAALVGICGCILTLYQPWNTKNPEPIPTRKQRFQEYVRGERQLMDEWEEAYGPDPVLEFHRSHGFMPERDAIGWKKTDEAIYQAWLRDHWPAIQKRPRYKPMKFTTREACKVNSDQFLAQGSLTPAQYALQIDYCNREHHA